MNKPILTFCTALALTLTCCGTAQPETDTSEAAAAEVTEAVKPEKQPTPFDGWASNTVISTGANYMLDSDSLTFRTYLPAEESGELEYCFYVSNTVDSTWERGRYSFVGKPGGAYRILSAHIADGGTSPDEALSSVTEVTFGGRTEKDVVPGETFWSDPVTIDIPEGHYLVWEWTIKGTDIPCTRMTELAHSFLVAGDGTTEYSMDVPAPQFIGARRDVKKRITCFGDSITQGAQTTPYAANFWVSELSESLGSEYSVWNCGLGYARASDAAQLGNWISRVKSGDIVTLAFGTNDLAAGEYGKMGASSADEIEGWLRTLVTELQEAGCTVILFNLPPFDFDADTEAIRQEVNTRIPGIAEELGCEFFDWNAILEDPDTPGASLYGGHPNDEGCALVAQAFLEQFGSLIQE